MLYLASILVGLAHGAHWTLMVATSSELFGLKNFGALYNTLRFVIDCPVVKVAFSFYLIRYRELDTFFECSIFVGSIKQYKITRGVPLLCFIILGN